MRRDAEKGPRYPKRVSCCLCFRYFTFCRLLSQLQATRHTSEEQSTLRRFSGRLNALTAVRSVDTPVSGYEVGHLTCSPRHQNKLKPSSFCLQLCILLVCSSAQDVHRSRRVVLLTRALPDTRLPLASLSPHNPPQDSSPFPSSSGRFLPCSSLALERSWSCSSRPRCWSC